MGCKSSTIRHSIFKRKQDGESNRSQNPSPEQEHQSQRVDSSSSSFLLTGHVMSEGEIGTYRVVKAPMGSFNGPNDFRKYVDQEVFGQSGRLWYLEFENVKEFDDWVMKMASTYYGFRISFNKLRIETSGVDACLDDDGGFHFEGSGGKVEGRVMVQMPRWANIWWSLNGEDEWFKDEDWPSLFNTGVTFAAEPAPDPPIAVQRTRAARPSFEATTFVPADSGYSYLPPRGARHAGFDIASSSSSSSCHICNEARYLMYHDVNGRNHMAEIPYGEYSQASGFLHVVSGHIFNGTEILQFTTDLREFIHWFENAGSRWISFAKLELRLKDVSVEKVEGGIHFSDILSNAAMIRGCVVPKFNLYWSEDKLDYYGERLNILLPPRIRDSERL